LGWGIRFVQIKELTPFGAPIRGKIRKKSINLKKSSSHEQLAKIVSIVELDPQAMLTIRLPILSKNIIHYDVR